MVRLQLHALAYNLSNFLRTLATPEPIKDWSLIATSSSKWPRSPSHGKCFKRFCALIAELRPQPPPALA
jgi:hypothetical protein